MLVAAWSTDDANAQFNLRGHRARPAVCFLRDGDANGDDWAELIDTLTMYPDVRRQVVRLLAEMDAAGGR